MDDADATFAVLERLQVLEEVTAADSRECRIYGFALTRPQPRADRAELAVDRRVAGHRCRSSLVVR
jgi:hypothetical protein